MSRESATKVSYGLFAVYFGIFSLIATRLVALGVISPSAAIAALLILLLTSWFFLVVVLNRVNRKYHYVSPSPLQMTPGRRKMMLRSMQAGITIFSVLLIAGFWSMEGKPFLMRADNVVLCLIPICILSLALRYQTTSLRTAPQVPSIDPSPIDPKGDPR